MDTPTKEKLKNDPDTIDDRTLIEGLLQPNDVVRLGLILYAIGTISFLLLTHFSPAKEPYLAIIFFGALPLSFLYTGGIGNHFILPKQSSFLRIFQVLNTSLLVMFSFFSHSGRSLSSIPTWPKLVITVSIPFSMLYH